jgi:hypothetical protein
MNREMAIKLKNYFRKFQKKRIIRILGVGRGGGGEGSGG